MFKKVQNWSRYPRSRSILIPVDSREQEIPFGKYDVSFLPFGMGRSLGDSCLNDGNALLTTRGLSRVLSFDTQTGTLAAESGITFDAILRLAIPQGWFLPVTPGTRFVSLGGAIANDVHGKNHHRSGTFGDHVVRLELRRSDGSRIICSAGENGDWFRATIGGLGLTGLIEWAEIRLKPIVNSWIDTETIRYGGIDEFFSLSEESVSKYDYAVAWADTLSSARSGRGLFMRGNHNNDPARPERSVPARPWVGVPFVLPAGLLNRGTIRMFNRALYHSKPERQNATVPVRPFFYPLDSIGAYHRIYGPGGMIQWQALIPDREAAREVLRASAEVGGSFLTVIKVMGETSGRGLLSFSGKGVTIALDFPYSSSVMQRLPRLDDIVAAAGGRLYPAKDARMSGAHFRKFFPRWHDLTPFIDPRFSSSFWRRVTAEAPQLSRPTK